MLDRLGDAVFEGCDAGAVLHDRVTQELSLHDGGAELRLDLPFVSKGDMSLKKIGLELVVRVDGHKRTILLPGAMAGLPAGVGGARRRLAGRRLHRAGAGPCLTIRSTPSARPSGSCARRPSAPRSFAGSQIVWQYYPGAGIQIQVLGTFGKVNALWSSRQTTALGQAVDELLPLAAERAGGVAWEYYFPYRAGKAPWVSSLAQGTALQALSRAATRLKRQDEVFAVTSRGLGIFERAAPEGVRVPAGAGTHYAQYSFEPGLRILNGFIQSLVGLYDYGRLAADDRAQGAVRDRRGARPRGGADLRHRRLVAVLARDRHARVRPRLPHAAARLPDLALQPHQASRPTAAPRTASRPT